MNRRASSCLLALAASLFAAAGCSGGDDVSGTLVFGDQRGIIERTIESGEEKILVATPAPTTVLRDPAISRQGQLAFVQTATVRAPSGTRVTSSDLLVANRDGTNPRTVFTHQSDNQTMAEPQWLSDDRLLVVVRTPTDPAGTAAVSSDLFEVDVSIGVGRKVREGVSGVGIASDGNRIVFVGNGEQVIASRLDSPEARISLTAGSTVSSVFVGSPRYSADDQRIAFTAFEADTFPPRDEKVTKASLWVAPSGGGELRRVADFPAADRSALAWSGDGEHIFVLANSGLLQVDVESGDVRTLREQASILSAIEWQAPPADQEATEP